MVLVVFLKWERGREMRVGKEWESKGRLVSRSRRECRGRRVM
jgi:hypothetical protein